MDFLNKKNPFGEKDYIIMLQASEADLLKMLEVFYKRIVAENKELPEWIPEAKAMEELHIKSKTTMAKLRAEGKIAYSQMGKKNILYRRSSILKYIEAHEQKTF